MDIIAFEFGGNCTGCGSRGPVLNKAQGGVSVSLDGCGESGDECEGEWLCLTCASELAKLLTAAVTEVKAKRKGGYAYLNGKWTKRSRR